MGTQVEKVAVYDHSQQEQPCYGNTVEIEIFNRFAMSFIVTGLSMASFSLSGKAMETRWRNSVTFPETLPEIFLLYSTFHEGKTNTFS